MIRAATVPALVAQHLDLLACPACRGAMQAGDAGLACSSCGSEFSCEDGIARLAHFPRADRTADQKLDVTDKVKAFYEETPFPNYDDLDTPERLASSAQRSVFVRLLDEQIPHGSKILECGCGTGQLSNFLGLTWGRTVFGADMCLNSLKLGNAFRERHRIKGTAFVQMNLFQPAFRDAAFDLVVANGVLHHTADPEGAFQSILRCVRPGGLVIVGLYNRYARLTTDLRRLVFRVGGDRLQFLDPRLRKTPLQKARRDAWYRDQYEHPHESKHTFDEVLRWFDASGVTFVNSIPKCSAVSAIDEDEQLFESHTAGSAGSRVVAQLAMLARGGREGGFFTMIGRKAGS